MPQHIFKPDISQVTYSRIFCHVWPEVNRHHETLQLAVAVACYLFHVLQNYQVIERIKTTDRLHGHWAYSRR